MGFAVCESCERRFRLPEGRRASRCPKCGGRVVLEDRDSAREAPSRKCPSCGARAWAGDEECHACGRSLAGAKLSTGSGPDEAIFGRHQYQQANRMIIYVRLVYLAAVLYLGLTVLSLGILWGTVGSIVAPFFLVFAVALGLAVTGFLKVTRQPFLWTLLLAVLLTVNAALILLMVLGGETGSVGRGMVRALVASVIVWTAVPVAYKVRGFVEADPDFFVPAKRKKRVRGTAARGQVVERARARGRAARVSGMKQALLFGAPVLLVVIVGIYAVAASGPSISVPPFEPTIEKFVEAWNASDYDAIGALCSAKNGRRMAAWLRRMPEKKGWGEGLPRLGEADPQTLDHDPTRVVYEFPVPDLGSATVVVRFEWEDERWMLKKLSPPK